MRPTCGPVSRGELEITDLNNIYLAHGKATLIDLGRGFAWLDTGTHDSLLEAGQFVQVLEHRAALRISCLEEIALADGFITPDAVPGARSGTGEVPVRPVRHGHRRLRADLRVARHGSWRQAISSRRCTRSAMGG